MKKLGILFFTTLAASALAQTARDSVPAGFTTLSVAGNGGSGAKLTYGALGITQAVEWQGTSTALSGTTLTDSAATWADNQFNGASGQFYLEIISVGGSATASGVGATFASTATAATAKTITLASAPGLASPVGYRIRKSWTLADVFGATNSAGLQSGSATSADQVLVWSSSGFETFYYQTTGIGGTGWRKASARSADASATILPPTAALIVKRGASAAVSLISNGSMKTGQTAATVATGFTYIGNPYDVPMTLASSGIYAAGLAGGAAASADQVLVWNGTTFDAYFYQTSGGTGTGWRKTTDLATDASAIAIAANSGFVVKRTGAAFTWAIPQHPSAL